MSQKVQHNMVHPFQKIVFSKFLLFCLFLIHFCSLSAGHYFALHQRPQGENDCNKLFWFPNISSILWTPSIWAMGS